MKKIFLVFTAVLSSLGSHAQEPNIFNIIDFGARGDGKSVNTRPIQKAIDKAAGNGGGKVVIPAPGIFVSGTIHLKNKVTLQVQGGATLLGSADLADYDSIRWGHNIDRQPYHLIYADSVSDISIEGKGTIDGNGMAFWEDYEKDANGDMVFPRWLIPKKKKISPLVEISRCRNITIKDVTLKTGGGWTLHLYNCDVARVQGINIDNNVYSPNSDGIDITGCNDVMVSDCFIKTCDDAVCVKTTDDSRESHRIAVNNCIIETLCVGLKLGCNESAKDITDVTFSNCIVNKSSRAVGIYVKDGGTFERITITNIVANTNAPLIFNRPIQIMVNKLTERSKPGTIRNVIITNFVCETEGRILLTCAEGGKIENIVLRDIILRYPMIENPLPMLAGAGSAQFPKAEDHPAAIAALCAVVADNIDNLVVENLQIQWPSTESTPQGWQHPERIENGTLRIHRMDYSKARQTEFSVLWGQKLRGGYLNSPLAKPSTPGKIKYMLNDCTIDMIR